MKSKQLLKYGFGNELYAQVVLICKRELDDKKEKDKTKYKTSKGNQQEQTIGLVLIK